MGEKAGSDGEDEGMGDGVEDSLDKRTEVGRKVCCLLSRAPTADKSCSDGEKRSGWGSVGTHTS